MSKRCPRKGCKADMSGMRADAVWCSRKCYIAVRRDPRAYRDPTEPSRSRSGRQLSYRRTVEWLTLYLVCTQGLDPQRAQHNAELQLSALLPERQRAA